MGNKNKPSLFIFSQKRYSVGMLAVDSNKADISSGAHSEVVYNYNPNCDGFVLDIETGEHCSAIVKVRHCVVSLDSICRCEFDHSKNGATEMSLLVSIRYIWVRGWPPFSFTCPWLCFRISSKSPRFPNFDAIWSFVAGTVQRTGTSSW